MIMKIKQNQPLSSISTFGIGGDAEFFTEVLNERELSEAIDWARKRNIVYRVCGRASNIIFPDAKLEGLLIKITGGEIEQTGGNTLNIDAGVDLAEAVNYANDKGLKGLETLAGIPGTVGGAVVGNAGAYGVSISEVVNKALVWDRGETKWMRKDECEFSYRESVFKESDLIVLKVNMIFSPENPDSLKNESKKITEKRNKKYSPGLKCPGSFFKNVLVKDLDKETLEKVENQKIVDGKIPAGYLLEEVGAKGEKVGDIEIADFHGNLFINKGKGTARQVIELANILKERVKNKFGITLEEEVRFF